MPKNTETCAQSRYRSRRCSQERVIKRWGVWGIESTHPPGHGSTGAILVPLRRRQRGLGVLRAAREADGVETRRPGGLRRRMDKRIKLPPNFESLVLGCIDAEFCN